MINIFMSENYKGGIIIILIAFLVLIMITWIYIVLNKNKVGYWAQDCCILVCIINNLW